LLPRHVAPLRIPLPPGWKPEAREGLLTVAGLLHYALVFVRGFAEHSPLPRVR
jgi:hypothetical protein